MEPAVTQDQEQIEELQGRIRDLENDLGNIDHLGLCTAFGLSSKQGKLLALLISRPAITGEMIEERYQLASDAKVAIHRLRKKLLPHNIAVSARYGVGYALSPEMKDHLKELLTRLGIELRAA